MKSKIIRTSTVSLSMDKLLEGQLRYLNQYYEVIAVSGECEHLRIVEAREDVIVHPISMQRSISPIKDLITLWKLYLYLKKEKPQIVHSITPKAGLLSMCASYFANIPIRIHTFTGLIFPTKTGFIQQLLIVMDKLLCKFATNIYPEGEGVKKDLINYNITNKPLKVLANGNVNGIDTAYFNPNQFSVDDNSKLKKELNIRENDFVFIFVGRLVSDKGIDELIEAFDKLSNTCKMCKLLLVGMFESELDPLKEITLKKIKCNASIINVGFQNDVRTYFAISDALVFPSYREGFPNVVLQAGAMGLPSIVSDINGCNEIIINGTNGMIIPVKDSEAIFVAMKEFINNVKLKNALQKNARNMITELYEQKIIWEALLKEYKSLEKNVNIIL